MTIFIRGMLCNWMVSLGVIGAMMLLGEWQITSNSECRILLFFAMGFEHSVREHAPVPICHDDGR